MTRCTCDLRYAQWNPYTGKCGTCGGLEWRAYAKQEEGESK